MSQINQNLDKLREYALKSGQDEEFEEVLQEWTNQMDALERMNEYREFEVSKSISKALVSICLAATRKLIREKDLIERAKIEQDLDRCQWLLKFYANNPNEQLKNIEDEINQEIIKFEL